MAYQQDYYGYPGEQGYQEREQQLAMSMGETELMYYQDQYRQQVQFQQGSEQQPVMHRYSVTSCKSRIKKKAHAHIHNICAHHGLYWLIPRLFLCCNIEKLE